MTGLRSHPVPVALVGLGLLLAFAGCVGALQVPGAPAEPSPEIGFEEVANESGLQYSDVVGSQVGVGNASVYAADVDRDGWTDVLASGGTRPALFRNDEGAFEAADYDGDEDLLVYQSGDWANGKPTGYVYTNATIEEDNGNRNLLYENVGGRFERVEDASISEDTRWSLAASFVDLDDDGRPDIHVANDYNTDALYVNEGDGTFREVLLEGNTSRNGMASAISDFDGDARPDIFVTNIDIPLNRQTLSEERYEAVRRLFSYVVHSGRTEGNTLLFNEDNGTFDDAAAGYDIQTGGWGWAASHVDLNNDGSRDVFHTTQNVVAVDPDDPIYTYPMVFERTGENFTRLDADEIGLQEDDGRGMITLDYDRDGQMEIVSANYVGQYSVYDNAANASRVGAVEFLTVADDGSAAYGAEIEVDAGAASRTVFQHSRTGYLSQEPRENHVGLGARESATLSVTWPDGTERTFADVPAGRYVHLHRNGTVETVVEFDG